MAPLATGLLESGNHTVEVLADGMPFASASFTVTRLGTAFLQGAQGSYTLETSPRQATTFGASGAKDSRAS